MKKILSVFLTAALLLCLPFYSPKADASEMLIAGRVTTSGGNLNVRSDGRSDATIKTSIRNKSLVTVLSQKNDFFYVRYGDGLYGYCHKSYIKAVSESSATVNTASGSLNVRSGEGTSYAIKDRLRKGERVVILSSSGSWSYVLYNGNKTGYVSSSYLKADKKLYSAVSLSVPYLSQTDSRWADVIIGTSGKTIGKIGCATTSIAMMESFRLGYTIRPDTMAKKLTYSSTGNVYWPSYYKVTTNESGCLEKILEALNSGKPVLFGGKNYYNSQHWIVITGFRGGELTAGNFTINDPGSKTRSTLADFISAYPVFYKYFSY